MATVNFIASYKMLRASWRFARTQRMGPETLGGVRQVVGLPGGRWYASLTFALNRKDRVLAYRAWLADMQGTANATVVPVCDPYGRRDLGSGTLGGNASVGATSISLVGVAADARTPGCYVTLSPCLYIIKPGGAGSTINIEPPLRFAASTGATVYTAAFCKMRLVSASDGAADLDLLKFGQVTVNFIEAIEEP